MDEKYCDSLEDLILTKVAPGDVLFCDENTLKFSAFRLREDRVALRFNPPVRTTVSLAYLTDNRNPALALLAQFLREKFAGNDGVLA